MKLKIIQIVFSVGQNFVHIIGKKVRRFIHNCLISGMRINLLEKIYYTMLQKQDGDIAAYIKYLKSKLLQRYEVIVWLILQSMIVL